MSGLAALTGCGPLRVGQPADYTPPPPGIDDLYREDLIALLERGHHGAVELAGAVEPAARGALDGLAAAVAAQRGSLLTGAQAEGEQEQGEGEGEQEQGEAAGEDPGATATQGPAPAEAPGDVPALVDLLVELRDLTAAAARQVSGSLARPVIAIGCHTAWAAPRIAALDADSPAIPAPPSAEEVTPEREVPESDPPSIGAEVDYHRTIENAQHDEWYAGHLLEVAAARVPGPQSEELLARTELHRSRAETLGAVAEEDGAPVVLREAVYPLPDEAQDEEAGGSTVPAVSRSLMDSHIALVGAAPFARRSLPIAAALEQASILGPLVESMEPLPTLEPDGG